jgi:hypothetical protein
MTSARQTRVPSGKCRGRGNPFFGGELMGALLAHAEELGEIDESDQHDPPMLAYARRPCSTIA